MVFFIGLCAACHPDQPVYYPPASPPLPPGLPGPTSTPAIPFPTHPYDPPIASTELTPRGYNLILEFEVGGESDYNPHPEAPDARYSGVTWGIGYDAHQNSRERILGDWEKLPEVPRLAATQPYYGRSAQQHLAEVRDIFVAWAMANDVFTQVDVAREFANCRRAYSGFDNLRPDAQAALISLGFNRGYSTAGPNRAEMRELVTLVPKQDYAGMARALRDMKRVWRGTAIENGMSRRREAEARLIENS